MKKVKGSVSLFVAMIFLLVVAVVVSTIQSARIQGGKVIAATALNMGMDSLFANYDNELFSQFGVLLLNGASEDGKLDKDVLAGALNMYMEYNIDVSKDLYFASNMDLYGITINGILVEDIIRATDGGGLIWQDMVVDYEKYAKVVNLAAEYLGVEGQTEEAKAVDSICTGMNAVSTKIMVVNEKARAMIVKVDGIVCDKNGVDQDYPGTVAYFFKQFCPFPKTMEGLNIHSQKLVDAIKSNLNDPFSMINEAIKRTIREEKCDDIIKKISKNANTSLIYLNEAIALMTEVQNSQLEIDREIENLDNLINSNAELIEDETMKGIMEQYDAICSYNEILLRDICDVETMSKALKENKVVITNIYNACRNINYDCGFTEIKKQLQSIQAEILKISFEGISFNYENLKPSEDNTDILNEISEFLEVGVMSLLVPEGTSVSTRTITETDLASTVTDTSIAAEIQKESDINTILTKRIIYTEYVMDNFYSFTDKKEGAALNYEVEYILFGKEKDVDNLTAAAFAMATIRSGTNMVYLITDSDKRNDAYQVAFNLVGTAKYEPVIRIVQFALMYLWAYAEAILDVKILLEGKDITLKKSDETWQLSIENLLSMNLDGEPPQQNGISYEEFLRLLLYMTDDGKKSAYTMDLVELWMISKGRKKFRLKYCLYGLESQLTYSLSGGYSYEEKAGYTY